MKRVLLFFFLMILIILVIPSIIVLFFAKRPYAVNLPDNNNSSSMQVTVLRHTDGSVESVDLEEYLLGVLAGEMPASFHIEALKAQAVAARTYILNKKDNPGPDHPEADICTDSTHCKAWLSDREITERFGEGWLSEYGPKVRSAVEATFGQVMLYDQRPITAVFHSTSSGRTENAEDVWGGSAPYLRSVESPGDQYSPKFYSEVSVTREEFAKKLSDYKGHAVGCEIGAAEYTQGGAVRYIEIGAERFRGTEIRSIFSLPSSNFTIEEVEDGFVFHVKGSGHGVGLSQYGADYFGKSGKTYEEILKIYYQGVEIVKYY